MREALAMLGAATMLLFVLMFVHDNDQGNKIERLEYQLDHQKMLCHPVIGAAPDDRLCTPVTAKP